MRNHRKLPLCVTGLASVLLASSLAIAQPVLPDTANAPVKTFGQSKPIPDRYIIKFTDSVRDPAAEARSLMNGRGGQIHYIYTHAFKGFAASIPPQSIGAISSNPWVEYVEQDQSISVNTDPGTQSPTQSWGLDRIDQRLATPSNSYKFTTTGAGVYAYIIDTGIYRHLDFAGRVGNGYDAISGTYDSLNSTPTNDCNGHGTHVTGTVGGSTYGVAKDVLFVPVRVLDCRGSGSTSGVIAGINYVIDQVTLSAANPNPRRPAVANMSLGGGASSSLDTAVQNAVNAGVTMAVAAGNSNADACNSSPARAPAALTVGATDSSDSRASYSNFGTCLDLFAPGTSITSTWNNGGTNTISGTSMATPHVTGVAALAIKSLATPLTYNANFVKSVGDLIQSTASKDKVINAGTGSANFLLYSLMDSTDSTGPASGNSSNQTAPATPASMSYSSLTKNSVVLGWSDVANETGYYVDISSNGSPFSRLSTLGANATSLKVISLRSKTTYSFRVSAYNSVGPSGYASTNFITP